MVKGRNEISRDFSVRLSTRRVNAIKAVVRIKDVSKLFILGLAKSAG